jgi:exodeoxyribonuclease-5
MSNIILEGEQLDAVKDIRNFYKKQNDQCYILNGYAGTGKTTISQYIINDLGLDNNEVVYCAPTAKAAKQLRNKGLTEAKTYHSHFYLANSKDKNIEYINHYINNTDLFKDDIDICFYPIEEQIDLINERYNNLDDSYRKRVSLDYTIPTPIKFSKNPNENLKFRLKSKSLYNNIKLILIDEFSMVTSKVFLELQTLDKPIITLGDRGQLKSIGGENYHINNPNMELTKLHRFAEKSPINFLATKARKGEKIKEGLYGNVLVINEDDFYKNEKLVNLLLTTEQTICGYNKTVKRLNDDIRYMRGIDVDNNIYPIIGEKLLCRKNNYDLDIINGDDVIVRKLGKIDKSNGIIHMDLENEYGRLLQITKCNLGRFDEEIEKNVYYMKLNSYEQFYYSYVKTTHSCQGGQFKDGVIFNEAFGSDEDRRAWLYTAITRFMDYFVLVI